MVNSQNEELETLLGRMENPDLKQIDLSLERMLKLLSGLGRPHRKLPPVIHVAGTNGKGSVIAYLRSLFEASGATAHVYTSPHLIRFNERIVVAGHEVSDEELLDALYRVRAFRDTYPSTFFESTTAAAMLLFAQHPADVLLLEVGLGGRLDATNVIEDPLLTVITPISKDHTEYLGDDLTEIAAEKAAIMKPGVPCVVGKQYPEVLAVIEQHATEIGAPLHCFGHEWKVEEDSRGSTLYASDSAQWEIATPPLIGTHQWENAATALACIDQLQRQTGSPFAFSPRVLETGIEEARWPARLQYLTRAPWLSSLPEGSEIWLDGGHNPAAGEMIAGWVRDAWDEGKQIHLVCSMLGNKNHKGFLQPLADVAKHLWAVPMPAEQNVLPSEEMVAIATDLGIKADACQSIDEAMLRIGAESKGAATPPRVVIAGSLYLAGHVLAQLESEMPDVAEKM